MLFISQKQNQKIKIKSNLFRNRIKQTKVHVVHDWGLVKLMYYDNVHVCVYMIIER